MIYITTGYNINQVELALKTILEQLQEKNVKKLTQEEATNFLKDFQLEKEIETGIAGPIKVLKLDKEDEKLILESDQKGNHFIRIIESKNVEEFTSERLSIYDKMWDGCGCKVFYDEVWFPTKNQEISLQLAQIRSFLFNTYYYSCK